MGLDGDTVNCYGLDKWGQTGAACTTQTKILSNFYNIVTQVDDNDFFAQAGAPSEIFLETDRAVVTINMASGVEVTEKFTTCNAPQPTLNVPWRCAAQGGISDSKSCLWSPTPPTPPSPSPPQPPRPKSAACSQHAGCAGLVGNCCPADNGKMLACCSHSSTITAFV